MTTITLKKMLPLLAAIFFAAAACTSRTDSGRNDNYNNDKDNTSAGGQAGNAQPGSRQDTMTGSGTVYQGANSGQNNGGGQTSTGTYGQNNTTTQGQSRTSQNEQGNRNGTMGQTGSTSSGNSSYNQTNASNIPTADHHFAMEAIKGGRMEVEMGNQAVEKAQSTRVKDFAQMMVTDHTKANNELENILSRKNMMTEVERERDQNKMLSQNHMDDMNNKTGKDFDVAYMRMMVNDHNKDIDLFKKESNSGKDMDLKDFATKTLPILRTHLDSAKAIYGSLNGATSTRRY